MQMVPAIVCRVLLASTQVPKVLVPALIVLLASTQVPQDQLLVLFVLMAATRPPQDHRFALMYQMVNVAKLVTIMHRVVLRHLSLVLLESTIQMVLAIVLIVLLALTPTSPARLSAPIAQLDSTSPPPDPTAVWPAPSAPSATPRARPAASPALQVSSPTRWAAPTALSATCLRTGTSRPPSASL